MATITVPSDDVTTLTCGHGTWIEPATGMPMTFTIREADTATRLHCQETGCMPTRHRGLGGRRGVADLPLQCVVRVPIEEVRCVCGAVRMLDRDGGMPVHPDVRRLPVLTWCGHSRQDRWITASE